MLDPLKDALLVIDVVNDFGHQDAEALLQSFRRRLPAMVQTLERCRADGVPVIFVNDAAGRWDGDAPAHLRAAIESGQGGDVVSALAPRAGESYVFKPRYSAFDRTPLALILRDWDVERLLLMGASTEGCIVQSGIDGRELGFKATIVAGACATADRELERLALAYAERVGGIRID